jgi:hypothetical protein
VGVTPRTLRNWFRDESFQAPLQADRKERFVRIIEDEEERFDALLDGLKAELSPRSDPRDRLSAAARVLSLYLNVAERLDLPLLRAQAQAALAREDAAEIADSGLRIGEAAPAREDAAASPAPHPPASAASGPDPHPLAAAGPDPHIPAAAAASPDPHPLAALSESRFRAAAMLAAGESVAEAARVPAGAARVKYTHGRLFMT